MPDKLTVAQFAAKIKERRPDLANIPDGTLVGKTLAAAPQLKEFVELTSGAEAPKETGVMDYFSHLGVRKDDPAVGSLGRSISPGVALVTAQPSVMSEGAAQVLRGVGQGTAAVASPVLHPVDTATALLEALLHPVNAASGAKEGLSRMLSPVVQGTAELAAPETFQGPAPGAPEWEQSQQGAGASLALAEAPNVLSGGKQLLANALRGVIPSTARAGANLEKIKQAVGNNPVNTGPINSAVAAAQEERRLGGGRLTDAMRAYSNTQKPMSGKLAGVPVQASTPPPLTYSESFRIASNAKRPGWLASRAMSDSMKAATTKFVDALQSENRAVAAQAGMGDLFDAAMKEYRQAKTIENATKIAKKYAARAAMAAALGGAGAAGYEIYRGKQ